MIDEEIENSVQHYLRFGKFGGIELVQAGINAIQLSIRKHPDEKEAFEKMIADRNIILERLKAIKVEMR